MEAIVDVDVAESSRVETAHELMVSCRRRIGKKKKQGVQNHEERLGWTRRENTIAQLRRQTQDTVSGWSVGGWFDDGSSFALRSDLGPSSKRAVQLCTRCDRATGE